MRKRNEVVAYIAILSSFILLILNNTLVFQEDRSPRQYNSEDDRIVFIHPQLKWYPNVTVVSAIYDIKRHDRSIVQYLVWMEYTFRMKYPMIIYCQPKLLDNIRKIRMGVSYPTVIVANENLPLENATQRVRSAILNMGYENHKSVEWQNSRYIPLQFSKFEWLLSAMAWNPFSTPNFYWMDAGMGRFLPNLITKRKLLVFDKIMEDKVSVQLSPKEKKPPRMTFIGQQDSPFIGTLFGGSIASLKRLCHATLSFFEHSMLLRNIVDNEQVAFSYLYRNHMEWFNVLTVLDFPSGHCDWGCL